MAESAVEVLSQPVATFVDSSNMKLICCARLNKAVSLPSPSIPTPDVEEKNFDFKNIFFRSFLNDEIKSRKDRKQNEERHSMQVTGSKHHA
jgi:hypothetical protein